MRLSRSHEPGPDGRARLVLRHGRSPAARRCCASSVQGGILTRAAAPSRVDARLRPPWPPRSRSAPRAAAPTTTPASCCSARSGASADLEITSAIQLIATVHAGGLLLVAEAPGEGIVGFSYAFAGVERRHASPALRHARGAPELARQAASACASSGRSARRRSRAGSRSSPGPSIRCAPRTPASTCATWVRSRGSCFPTSTDARARRSTTASRPIGCSPAGSSRARASSSGPPRKRSVSPTLRSARLNDVRLQAGLPLSSDPRLDLEAPRLLLQVPSDWDAVCRADAGVAREWQANRAGGRSRPASPAATRPWTSRRDTRRQRLACYVLERVTRRRSRPAAPGRTTTRSRSRRRASRAARRGAGRAGRGRR